MSFVYNLLQGDSESEKEPLYSPALDKSSDGDGGFIIAPRRPDNRWNLLQFVRTSGVFILGAVCTAALFVLRDGVVGRATYETGFTEEKIRKLLRKEYSCDNQNGPSTYIAPQYPAQLFSWSKGGSQLLSIFGQKTERSF